MAQSDARPTGVQKVAGSSPAWSGNILSSGIDHELFSTVILSLPLIQGHCQFLTKECAHVLVDVLEDCAYQVN